MSTNDPTSRKFTFDSITNIVPFTARAGDTYLTILEKMAVYLSELAENVNTSLGESATAVTAAIEQAMQDVDDVLALYTGELDGKLADFESSADSKLAQMDAKIIDLMDDVNSAVQTVINSSIEVQDPVAAALISDVESLTSAALAERFMSKDSVFIVNVRDYGATGDGETDDTAAINAAISALPPRVRSFSGSGVLYFPAGVYRTMGGHTIPADKRVKIVGDGPYNTTLYAIEGYTPTAIIKINSDRSTLSMLTIDGNSVNTVAGEGVGVEVNADHCTIGDISIFNIPGSGIVFGGTAPANDFNLYRTRISNCNKYGVHVRYVSSLGVYDGKWSMVNIGKCGISGARLDGGANVIDNLHSWGNGWDTGGYGLEIRSGSNQISNSEFETNFRAGVGVFAAPKSLSSLVGCSFWGNANNGLYATDSGELVVSASRFFRNGAHAPADDFTSLYSAVHLNTCSSVTIAGCNFFDDSQQIPALTYQGAAPAKPYLGKPARLTQSRAIIETGTCSNNIYSSNNAKSESTTSGVPISLASAGSLGSMCANNVFGELELPTIPAQAVLRPSKTHDVMIVSGVVNVTTVQSDYEGRRVTLVFGEDHPATFAPSNVVLKSPYTPSENSTITLAYVGDQWIEVGR